MEPTVNLRFNGPTYVEGASSQSPVERTYVCGGPDSKPRGVKALRV